MLLLVSLVLWCAAAKELSINILDPALNFNLSHFAVDAATEQGMQVIDSLMKDPNLI